MFLSVFLRVRLVLNYSLPQLLSSPLTAVFANKEELEAFRKKLHKRQEQNAKSNKYDAVLQYTVPDFGDDFTLHIVDGLHRLCAATMLVNEKNEDDSEFVLHNGNEVPVVVLSKFNNQFIGVPLNPILFSFLTFADLTMKEHRKKCVTYALSCNTIANTVIKMSPLNIITGILALFDSMKDEGKESGVPEWLDFKTFVETNKLNSMAG